MRHQDLTKNHILESFVYPNAASRLAAGTFVSTDIGRIAYQSDTKQYWRLVSTAPTWQPVEPVIVSGQATPAAPASTASLVGVMMGLGVAFTPIKSGAVMILISGTMTNNTASDGARTQIRYGSGSAPANGAALTGTAVGGSPQYLNGSSVVKAPFALQAIISALTLGTAYWFDLSLTALTGGSATLSDLSISIIEL